MTKSQLVQKLADAAGLTKKQADAVLQELVAMTVTTVRKGDPVKIPGLGTFRKVQTKARMGRNPQTGAAIKIPARKKVRFSVAKTFKEAVLGAKKESDVRPVARRRRATGGRLPQPALGRGGQLAQFRISPFVPLSSRFHLANERCRPMYAANVAVMRGDMTDRSFGLFEPDALLPAQFYAAFRGGSAVRGERRLMLAVLQDALDCYQKYALAQDGHGRQLFADADTWIASEDRDWYFSFENICETLEINPEYLRRGVHDWWAAAQRTTRQLTPDKGASTDDGRLAAVG